MKIEDITKNLAQSPSQIIKELLAKKIIPVRIISEKTPLYSLWDIEKRYLMNGSNNNKESFKYLVGSILSKVISAQALETLVTFSVEVERVTRNPFIYQDFYAESNYYKGLNLNNIRYSEYARNLKSIRGKENIDLLLKSIRINDEIKFYDFSLTEIIIAHQTFHNTKIMAISCLYSEDRGVGKTTLSLAGGYLYDKSEDSYFKNINMGDGQKAQWGDYEIGTRTVVFDDIPNQSKIVEPLTARIKSSATSGGDITANKKGSGMVRTNSYNQALTTNSIYGIPLDDIRDRRIHPINIHSSDFADDEIRKIEMLDIPMSGARDKTYPIIQEILNHLYFVYNKTRNDGLVNKYLNKELPNTKFKIEVARRKASYHRRFEIIVLNCKTMDGLIKELAETYGQDEDFFYFINASLFADITKVRNKYFLHLKATGLVEIGKLFNNSEDLTAQKVQEEYFKTKEFKTTKIRGKSVRCVRFEIKDFQPKAIRELKVEYEDSEGNITENDTLITHNKQEYDRMTNFEVEAPTSTSKDIF